MNDERTPRLRGHTSYAHHYKATSENCTEPTANWPKHDFRSRPPLQRLLPRLQRQQHRPPIDETSTATGIYKRWAGAVPNHCRAVDEIRAQQLRIISSKLNRLATVWPKTT
jgi:hypothetical protein